MRDEVGVLIGLTYLISHFSPQKGATFLTGILQSSSHRPNSISLRQISMVPSLSNTSESQFLQNDLAVVPFKSTIIRSPDSPQ
jgi:hypothetical protein